MPQNLMPSALDKHITTDKDDAFGHRHFAQALRSLIESSQNHPPYSIGLLGGWGTGKSSIKELYIHDLEDDAQKSDKKLRKNRIKYITFNAWRFGGKDQDIKRALLRHVFIELGGTDDDINKELFCNVSDIIKKRYKFIDFLKESFFSSLYTIVPIIISLLLCLVAIILFGLTDSLIISAMLFIIVLSFTIIFKRYRIHSLDPYYAQTVLQLPATSTERYEQLLRIQLGEFKNGKGRNIERVVVFIDDLDRLSAEEMVSGLDAVRTFMEMPLGNMEGKIGIVFVISCDEAKVADALGSKGRKQSDMPGTVFNSSDARRYLDRIFQFRLEIPPFPRQDMRSFALSKLRSLQLPGLDEKLSSSGTPFETLGEYMIHADVQDPRNAIQIVNAFSQAWWLAKHREVEGAIGDLPGGLHENAVTGQPIIIAVLSAIKVNFPDFYKDLQMYPDLLPAYIDVIIRNQNPEEQPYDIKQILNDLYAPKQQDAATKPDAADKKKKRSLQRFLASVQWIKWPTSLQPYIFLSEDPISRGFGGKWTQAYIDLMSSNTQGLLENLGISVDGSPFTLKQVGILLQLFEKAKDESQIRKDHASKVVAELLPRVADLQANSLISALCREVCDSKDLRARLGVVRLANIVKRAAQTDKQDIAAELIQDVLNGEHDVDMLLETLQHPSLAEAVIMVKEVLKIVLEINEQVGLRAESSEQLCSWLLARRVKIGKEEYSFSYADFEEWINEHQDSLLSLLGEAYSRTLYEELSKEQPSTFDLSKSLERAKIIFDSLQKEGSESRATLWSQLSQFAGLRQAEAVKLAWETALQYVASPSQEHLSEFIACLSARIVNTNYNKEKGNFDLALPAAPSALGQIISKRVDAVDSHSTPGILGAVNRLACLNKSSKIGCQILDTIKDIDAEVVIDALTDWALKLSNISEDSLAYLFKNISILEPEKSKPVFDFLHAEVLTPSMPSDDSLKILELAAQNTPESFWGSDSAQFVSGLINNMIQRYSQQEYIESVFPITSSMLIKSEHASLGQMLNTLFSRNANSAILPILFSAMNGLWLSSEDIPNYTPASIFSYGCNYIVAYPETGYNIMPSLWDMIDRNIVETSTAKAEIVPGSLVLWKNGYYEISGMDKIHEYLTAAQLVGLVEAINWNENESISHLKNAWNVTLKSRDVDYAISSTKEILAIGPLGTEEKPEAALRLWCTILEKYFGVLGVFYDLLDDYQKSSVILQRLWQQIFFSKVNKLDDLLLLVKKIITYPAFSQLSNTLDDKDKIATMLPNDDAKQLMARSICEVFPSISSASVKSSAAKLCEYLVRKTSLGFFDSNQLSLDDVTILEGAFGNIREMKKIRKIVEKNIQSKDIASE